MAGGENQSAPPATVIALTSDLAAGALIRSAAEQAGAASVMALDSASALRRLAEADSAAIVVINLETRGLDIAALTADFASAAKQPDAVIAFGPHVHEAALQAAQAAGCDEVVSRGKFHASARELIARYLPR